MPPESAFRQGWWYRTQVTTPQQFRGKHVRLNFDGLNYRANLWLNGKQIGTAKEVAGAWRKFDFDVTQILLADEVNTLAVEIFPPTPEDLEITFVDWNPAPPDKDMGIWRDVYLTASGPANLHYTQVITKLTSLADDNARLTVTTEVSNQTDEPFEGTLTGSIDERTFSMPVALAPRVADKWVEIYVGM